MSKNSDSLGVIFWYGVFGILTTLVNIVVYKLFINLNVNYIISNSIAFIVSIVFSYFTNRKWVFKSKVHTAYEALNEFFKFCAARIGTFTFDCVGMIFLVQIAGINKFYSKILVNSIVIVMNYVFSKKFVFNDQSEKGRSEIYSINEGACMDLSIIIVSYNTEEILRQTIQSVIDTAGEALEYEIIVSDNGSKDGSCAMIRECFPQVKLIENNANLGFSGGNNAAIKKAEGRYILLLNSDTIVKKDCLKSCIQYMHEHGDIGVLGCRVLLQDGSLDHACKRGFPTPEASLFYMLKLHKLFPQSKRFGAYTLGYLPEEEINEVDSLTGAFMLLRREVIEKIGLLDEDFFMYGEDIDWCYRIKEAGFKVVYYPEASIIHLKGASSKKKRIKTIYEFHRAMYLFYNKHYLKKYSFVVTFLVYIGIGLKLILSLIFNLFKKKGQTT